MSATRVMISNLILSISNIFIASIWVWYFVFDLNKPIIKSDNETVLIIDQQNKYLKRCIMATIIIILLLLLLVSRGWVIVNIK